MKYKVSSVFGLVAFFCLFAVNFGVANALSVVYPANGLYSLQPQCAPNKELTVENAGINNGSNVFIWSINSNWHTQPSHQKWWIERVGNSEWYIMKAENSGKCLNVDGGAANDGTNITLWQQTDQNQWFRFFDAGNGYYIIQGHTHSGFYVLDVAAARNQDGTNVHVWHYNQGAPEQKWKLVRRNPSSQPQENWDSLVGHQVNINSPAYNPPLNKFSRGQCTWFAWGRMKDVTGKEITFRGSATAKLWKDNASNCVRCDLQSKCVAVRIYDSGHGNGHVAFVEHVEGNNVYYSQDNWTSDKNRKILKTTVPEFKKLYQYFIK